MPSAKNTALLAVTTDFEMKKLIVFLLACVVSANAASLELKVKQQKTLPNGNAYGLESGIYFKLTDLEPFAMYKFQYSQDFKKWTDLVYLSTRRYQDTHKKKWAMTSPYWTWKELPPYQCFFRLVLVWENEKTNDK